MVMPPTNEFNKIIKMDITDSDVKIKIDHHGGVTIVRREGKKFDAIVVPKIEKKIKSLKKILEKIWNKYI